MISGSVGPPPPVDALEVVVVTAVDVALADVVAPPAPEPELVVTPVDP